MRRAPSCCSGFFVHALCVFPRRGCDTHAACFAGSGDMAGRGEEGFRGGMARQALRAIFRGLCREAHRETPESDIDILFLNKYHFIKGRHSNFDFKVVSCRLNIIFLTQRQGRQARLVTCHLLIPLFLSPVPYLLLKR
jgi:hypothetical protein